MNWYLVELPNQQSMYVHGESLTNVRDLLREVYAFSGQYTTTQDDIDNCEITTLELTLDDIHSNLRSSDQPTLALDPTTPNDEAEIVTLWKSQVTPAGKTSLETTELHRYDNPETMDETARF